MKKLYFLLFFAFSFLANAQIVNIPDSAFKSRLISANTSNFTASINSPVISLATGASVSSYNLIDTNGDGEIQVSEASVIKYLDVGNISDLTGIEAFVNLEALKTGGNTLVSPDFSNNNNIKYLKFTNINLTSLDFSNFSSLIYLEFFGGQLQNLNLSNCSSLQGIRANNIGLNSLSLYNCQNLLEVQCQSNNLVNLDLSTNPNLEFLFCFDNNLTTINLLGCNNLIELDCHLNQLQEIDINNCEDLEQLICSDNSFLKYIFFKANYSLINIDLDNIPLLEYICISNYIQTIQNYCDSLGYNCHVNSYCSFTPGGTFYEITGISKFDFDYNGCDINDVNYSNLKLNVTDGTNSGSMIANTTGNYYFPVQAGNHTITPVLENPAYFTILPASFTVDFPTQASPFAQDFCITANGVHSDVEVVLIPITPARPGFDAQYRIIYKNIGNQVENGLVTFAYQEDVLDFVSSSLSASSQNTLANTTTLSWNYSNLMPFETRTIDVVLNVNSPTEIPAVNIGDVLGIFSEITTINTDEDLSNNSSGLRQVVVGSYDPNDKTCVEGEVVDISIVGEYVHYVIRFENTGTYPAENIVVKDMIDISKFDISTLVPLHGSHEFFTRINDNKVEFIFENINLDFNDATNDGYVAFKIKTLPTLTVGDTFSNEASIYFDYNFPITTNEYITTIDNVLNNQDFSFENEFVLYPNPATAILNISAKNQTEIQSVEIYNIVGQVVIAIPNSTKAIDVSNLETGTYFIKVNTGKGSTTTKFVKE